MIIQTNRDLYLAIAQFGKEQKATFYSLEEYLCSLWSLASEYQDSSSLLPTEFYKLLSDAFSTHGPSFQESWRHHYNKDNDTLQGYLGWQATIRRQIVDLREMDERGILKDKYRHFGVDAPRGHRWYNFDPIAFLECAMVGTYGGWQSGDDTGRDYVPGKVAVFVDGRLEERDPDTIPHSVCPITQISWDDFRRFLYMGQTYE